MSQLTVDDVVALSRIVAGTVGRPLTPDESARLKRAYTGAGDVRTLHTMAERLTSSE